MLAVLVMWGRLMLGEIRKTVEQELEDEQHVFMKGRLQEGPPMLCLR